MILRHQITRAGGRRGRLASGRAGDDRRGDLPDVGRREEIAGARRLLLLGNALLLRRRTGRRRRHAGRRSARIGDRPAEIAGKRRPQLGCGFRQAGIVARQIGEAIRGHPVAGVVEFGPGGLVLRPESEEQARRRFRWPRPCQGRGGPCGRAASQAPGWTAAAFPAAADHRREAPPPLHAGFRSRLRPPVSADDTNLLLGIAAEPQLGRGEQPIDDHVVALDAVVHQLGAALRRRSPRAAASRPGRCRPGTR